MFDFDIILTIFNLSPTQKTCLFTDGNKASVCDIMCCVYLGDIITAKNGHLLRRSGG